MKKIKNKSDETIGYLFGTSHKPSQPVTFHDRIYKYINLSHTLWIEKKFNIEELTEEIKQKSPELSENEVSHMVNTFAILHESNPMTTEDFLVLLARSLGINVQGLETYQSREAAKEAIREEKENLTISCRFFAFVCFGLAAVKLQKALCDAKEHKDVSFELRKINHLLKTSLEMDYNGNLCREILELALFSDQAFSDVRLETSFAKDLLLFYHANKNLPAAIRKAWKEGDEKKLKEISAPKSNFQILRKQVMQKYMHIRDRFMADKIHQDLCNASEKHRSFYAMGALHIIDDYENVANILRDKGWRIVSGKSAGFDFKKNV